MGFGEWNENRKRQNMIRERTEKANETRAYKKVSYQINWACRNCHKMGTTRVPEGVNAEGFLDSQICPNCKNSGTLVPNYG